MAQGEGSGDDQDPGTDGDSNGVTRPPGFWKWTLLWLGGIVGLILLNQVGFALLLDRSYVLWYLANGVFISLAFGLVTLAWGDLNRLTGLISAHPWEYAVSCVAIVEMSFHGITAMQRGQHARDIPWGGWGGRPAGLGWLDSLLAFLFAILIWLGGLAWLLIAAPMQYVVTLIAGAPARLALSSSERAWFQASGPNLQALYVKYGDDAPEDAVEIGFTARPVTLTTLVTAGLLLVTSAILR